MPVLAAAVLATGIIAAAWLSSARHEVYRAIAAGPYLYVVNVETGATTYCQPGFGCHPLTVEPPPPRVVTIPAR